MEKYFDPIQYTNEEIQKRLDEAHTYAKNHSTCSKVQVGSLLVGVGGNTLGANHGSYKCANRRTCRRIELYGDNSKEHRLPSDCDALHSEIDCITRAAQEGRTTLHGYLFVTRYPCEACARAIGQSGITRVIYGRKESISAYTRDILQYYGVSHVHVDWDAEDDNR